MWDTLFLSDSYTARPKEEQSAGLTVIQVKSDVTAYTYVCLLVCLSACWLAGWLAGLLACWLAGLLACWLAGLLACWLVHSVYSILCLFAGCPFSSFLVTLYLLR